MKKIILGLSLIGMAVVSCKKTDSSCPSTVASIAGSYKQTNVTQNGIDITSSLSACDKSQVMKLNANKTTTTTAGAGCDTSMYNETGTWDISGSKIIMGADTSTFSFDCSHLVSIDTIDVTASQITVRKTTFTKQ